MSYLHGIYYNIHTNMLIKCKMGSYTMHNTLFIKLTICLYVFLSANFCSNRELTIKTISLCCVNNRRHDNDKYGVLDTRSSRILLTLGASDLPDMHALSPWACSPRVLAYVSGKSLVLILQLLCICIYLESIVTCKTGQSHPICVYMYVHPCVHKACLNICIYHICTACMSV